MRDVPDYSSEDAEEEAIRRALEDFDYYLCKMGFRKVKDRYHFKHFQVWHNEEICWQYMDGEECQASHCVADFVDLFRNRGEAFLEFIREIYSESATNWAWEKINLKD